MRKCAQLVFPIILAACQTETVLSEPGRANITALAGSEWGPKDSPEIFIAFKADGSVHGSGGCNRFFSQYSLTPGVNPGAGQLEFGPVGATKKMCPPALMTGERSLFEALAKTASAEFSHLTLKLADKDGTPLLTLQRRDWD